MDAFIFVARQDNEFFLHMFSTFLEESDRGVVLVATSFLDACLRDMLHERFMSKLGSENEKISKELLGSSRPVGNFSARIDLAMALGLIPIKVGEALHLTARLRNKFAHFVTEDQTFQSPDIQQRVTTIVSRVSPFPFVNDLLSTHGSVPKSRAEFIAFACSTIALLRTKRGFTL